MKKLETIIYIVGPKRSWEFQARHVKRIFLFILLVILGLGGTIGYQEYDHLQALKKADEKLDQENLKNEKLLALIARIREEGMKDNPTVTTTDVDLSKQQKLNEQQSILIEQQRKELGDLKGVLTQRERVIQQFQLEKQSTKDQVIDLQEKLRVSQENFEQASLETQTTQQQVQDIQKELEIAQKSLDELKKKNSVKPKIVESSANSKSVISVSNLKIVRSASNKINISLRINNNSKQRQSGRVGIYLSSNENAKKPMPYSAGKTQSFAIRRFKTIQRELVNNQSSKLVRVIVWNSKKDSILDQVFPIPN